MKWSRDWKDWRQTSPLHTRGPGPGLPADSARNRPLPSRNSPALSALSLQPAAGAQGELTGILIIRAFLAEQGNPRKYILIPDSAHGTNPASVAISGYEVRHLKSVG